MFGTNISLYNCHCLLPAGLSTKKLFPMLNSLKKDNINKPKEEKISQKTTYELNMLLINIFSYRCSRKRFIYWKVSGLEMK